MASRTTIPKQNAIFVYDEQAFWNCWDELVDEIIEVCDEDDDAGMGFRAERLYGALHDLAQQISPPNGSWQIRGDDEKIFKDLVKRP